MQHIIRIEEPCNESWNAMTPNDNGRHCDRCCKTVVDFTEWRLENIAQYLQEKGKGNVCGHFRASQLNTPVETPEKIAEKVWHAGIPLYRKIAAVIILFFAVTISSCGTNNTTKPSAKKLTGLVLVPPPPDTTNNIHFDGTPSLYSYDSPSIKHNTVSKNTSKKAAAKHKQPKTQEAIEPDIMEPHFQGAPEMVPVDTNWRQHLPATPSDSTNK